MREASGWDDGAAAGCPDMFSAGPAAGMGAGARGVSLTGGLSFLCTAGLGGISEGAVGSGAEKQLTRQVWAMREPGQEKKVRQGRKERAQEPGPVMEMAGWTGRRASGATPLLPAGLPAGPGNPGI